MQSNLSIIDSSVSSQRYARKKSIHECEIPIDKSVPQVIVFASHGEHPDAKQGLEGQICLSVPHTHDRF